MTASVFRLLVTLTSSLPLAHLATWQEENLKHALGWPFSWNLTQWYTRGLCSVSLMEWHCPYHPYIVNQQNLGHLLLYLGFDYKTEKPNS